MPKLILMRDVLRECELQSQWTVLKAYSAEDDLTVEQFCDDLQMR